MEYGDDWTKFLVSQNGDLVTIPTAKEYAHRGDWINRKLATDFVKNQSYPPYEQKDMNQPMVYWLDNASKGGDPDADWVFYDSRVGGVTPCLRVALPRFYTEQELTQKFGLTKHRVNFGESVYQVALGELPQSEVDLKQKEELNQLYTAGDDAPDGFRRTGRWFTSILAKYNVLSREHHPEFIYNNEKYVRVVDRFNRINWYKVEPVQYWVKNSWLVRLGMARVLDLEATKVVVGGLPFYTKYYNEAPMWQNSLVRAYLNSAEVHCKPDQYGDECHWDYRQGGFLQESLGSGQTVTPTYTIPAGENLVEDFAFAGCRGIEKMIVPANVKYLSRRSFADCGQPQVWIEVNRRLHLFNGNHFGFKPRYIYIPRDVNGRWIVFSPFNDAKLEKDYFCHQINYQSGDTRIFKNLSAFAEPNFRANMTKFLRRIEKQKAKFIPLSPILKLFPTSEFENFFVNGNHRRWKKLVENLDFNLLDDYNKNDALMDLMKIYYTLGGFSPREDESERAFQYVSQYVAVVPQDQTRVDYIMASADKDVENNPRLRKAYIISNEIHDRFSGLEFKEQCQPTFIRFFMKYYHQNPNFMRFTLNGAEENDYLCAAHNNFEQLLRNFPNHVLNGNTRRNLLTPEFVAKHCSEIMDYKNVDPDNHNLSLTIKNYGYLQKDFDEIQEIYNQAKNIKSQSVIRADDAPAEDLIKFRILEKDDPMGFVLGDITNCCQKINGPARSCVRDGYQNPHAGFLVFEAQIPNGENQLTEKKRIIGQAYVWYDPETYTICYDNIEMPQAIWNLLKKAKNPQLSIDTMMNAVIHSADAIMKAMSRHGTKVERVTVGHSYNKLNDELQRDFKDVQDPAVHRGYQGYSDARMQYLIRTYDQLETKLTTMVANTAPNCLKANQNIMHAVEHEL